MKSLAGFSFGLAMYGMGLINGLGGNALLILPIGGSLVLIGTVILWILCFKSVRND
jgi:hypothetical protein